MSEELKPCPACGSISISLASTTPVYYCVCSYCNMYGPESIRQEEAKAAWNALPRRLRWTKEKPTKNGWYWWRTGGGCNLRGIVSVCIETDIMVLAGGIYKYLSQTTGEWAGPIPEPEELYEVGEKR